MLLLPVPWADAEAAPFLHPGDVLLGLLHLRVDLVHVALDPGQLLYGVPSEGEEVKEGMERRKKTRTQK